MASNSLNEAVGAIAGLVAGIVIITLFSLIATAIVVLLIGLRKSPKTTILSTALGIITLLIGNAIQLPWLIFIGITAGIIIGKIQFKNDKIHLFQTKTYLWIARIICAFTTIVSISLINSVIAHAQNAIGLAFIPATPLVLSIYGLFFMK